MKRAAILLLVLACSSVAGCTGTSGHPASPRVAGPSSPGESAPTARPAPSPVRLSPVVLRMDLSDAPARWRRVLSVPVGGGPHELGLVTDPDRTPIPYLPRSFAVAGDGSVWILDVVNKRIAHYDRSGSYLGEVGGLKFERFKPHPRDVVSAGGRLWLLQERSLADQQGSLLTTVGSGGSLRSAVASAEGHQLDVDYLFSGGPVGGSVYANADESTETDPVGFSTIDPASGLARHLPGLPVGPFTWIDLAFTGDAELDLTEEADQTVTIQPVRFQGIAGAGHHRIPMVAGGARAVQLDHAIGVYLIAAPSRASDAERFGDGAWFLRIGRGPLVWERLPEGSVSDEDQIRHLAVGPDGSVYLMLVQRDRVEILRRP